MQTAPDPPLKRKMRQDKIHHFKEKENKEEEKKERQNAGQYCRRPIEVATTFQGRGRIDPLVAAHSNQSQGRQFDPDLQYNDRNCCNKKEFHLSARSFPQRG